MSVNAYNGRSSSQISIYNYPEHLNPFYEDEQHKRLRFWKLPSLRKNEGYDKETQRRNSSFSVTSLRDFWSSKSFRLKKRSSTLGINKTSESPPPLKRDYRNNTLVHEPFDNGTKDLTFKRNNLYRSSLQNIQYYQKNDAGAVNIQNNYLKTAPSPNLAQSHQQTPLNRNVYYRSLTPQPNRSSNFNQIHSSGAATLRLASSTNPFECENNSHEVKVKSSGIERRRPKRRAPDPPIKFRETEKDQSLSTNCELRISEDQLNETQEVSITNLTEQIENLVKIVNEEKPVETTPNVPSVVEPTCKELTGNDIEIKITEKRDKEISFTNPSTTYQSQPVIATQTNNNVEPKIHIETTNNKCDISKVRKNEQKSKNLNANGLNINNNQTTLAAKSNIFPKNETNDNVNNQQAISSDNVEIHKNTIVKISHHKNTINSFEENNSDLLQKQDGVQQNLISTKQKILPNTAINEINFNTNNVLSTKAKTLNNTEKVYTDENYLPSGPKIECIHFHLKSANKNIDRTPNTNMSTFKGLPDNSITAKTTFTVVNAPQKEIFASCSEKNESSSLEIVEGEEQIANHKLKTNETRPKSVTRVSKPAEESSHDVTPQQNIETKLYKEQQPKQIFQIVQPAFPGPCDDDLRTLSDVNSLLRTSENGASNQIHSNEELKVSKPKRRSVQSIIDSINESQRILNAAAHKNSTSPVVPRKLYDHGPLNNFERTSTRLIHNQPVKNSKEPISSINYTDSQKLNNLESFKTYEQKKKLNNYREGSPTTLNLDWNPLPKPKRTKNLSDCGNLE